MSDRLQAVTREPPKRGFGKWIGGRARRREYWAWTAPLVVAIFVLAGAGFPALTLILGLPLLFIQFRRLHDFGRTGWWAPGINVVVNLASYAMVAFLPPMVAGLGALVLFMVPVIGLGSIPGQPHDNEFGPPPGGKSGADLKDTFS